MSQLVGRIRMMERANVVLPQPDSPTRPRVVPASSVNETPSTARTGVAPDRNCVINFRISSKWMALLLLKPWIGYFLKSPANEEERKDNRGNRDARRYNPPPSDIDSLGHVRAEKDLAPTDLGRITISEETQAGFG